MEIEFAGQFEKNQYFKAIYLTGQPGRTSTLLRIGAFVLFLALAVGYAIAVWQDEGPQGFEIARLVRYGLTVAVLLYFVFQPYIKIYQTANKLWSDPLVRLPQRGAVSSLGVHYGSHLQPWDSFALKRQTPDLIVLLTADRVMSALPRGFFKSEAEWQRVRKLVEERVEEVK